MGLEGFFIKDWAGWDDLGSATQFFAGTNEYLELTDLVLSKISLTNITYMVIDTETCKVTFGNDNNEEQVLKITGVSICKE